VSDATRRALAAAVPFVLFSCAEVPATVGLSTAAPAHAYGGDWHWTDESGAEVTFSRWRGAPLVVTAVYTSCTTRCPLTIAKLRALDEAFLRKGLHGQFALVTLDPQTDDSARLRRYRDSRHLPPAWHMLHGGIEETRQFGRMMGVRAVYDDGHLDHEVRIAIFDRAGRLVRNFVGWNFDENEAAEAL
jgi:protein SCO1/2